MKALIVGDMHVQISNLEESQRLIDFICKTATQNQVDMIVFMGDQFHNHSVLRLEVIDFWRKNTVEKLSISAKKVVFLVGNHDICGDKQKERLMSGNDVLDGISNVVICNRPMKIEQIDFVPFTSDKEQFIRDCQELNGNEIGKTVLCHQTFNGAQYENGFFAPDGLDQTLVPQSLIISGHVHCFSNDFEYLTDSGFKKYEDVKDSDLLMSLNMETGFLEYCPILNRISREVDEDLVYIKNRKIDSLTTDKHNIVVESSKRKHNKFELVPADQIVGRQKIPLSGLVEKEPYSISDDEIRLIVWLITDGSVDTKTGKNGRFFSGLRWHLRKPRKIERITKLFDRMGIVYSNHLQKTGKTKIRMSNFDKYTKKLLEWCVIDFKKHLPLFLRKLNKRQFDVFLEEYGHTDGYFHGKRSIQISTQHKREADFIQELCHTNMCTCKVLPKKGSDERHWMLYVLKNQNNVGLDPVVNVSKMRYTGRVNCFTVKNGTLMVRRNGCVIISGNCSSSFGKVLYVGSPRWMSINDSNTEKNLLLATFVDGTAVNLTKTPTDEVCVRIFKYEVKEGDQLPEIKEQNRNYIELIGSTSWITKTKKKFPANTNFKITPTDRLLSRAEKQKKVNLQDFLESFTLNNGISKGDVMEVFKEFNLE